jgi:signal transduction histidine kinase
MTFIASKERRPTMDNARPVILNVDDNDAMRYARTRILERAGYRVIEASTGFEALALTRKDRPALLILDVKLPDVSGTDICAQIRQDPETADTMILQISAYYTTSQDRTAGLDCGADAYLTEPVPPEEFLASAHALLRRVGRGQRRGALEVSISREPETRSGQDSSEPQDLLRALSLKLSVVKDEEREKLAQSLHDDLAQLLVVARMKLYQHGHRPEALPVKEVDTVLEQCLAYTRSLMSDLMPPELSDGRLDVALRWLGERMMTHGLTVALDLPQQPILLPEEIAMTVLKSARELLFNILKHAGTREASVTAAVREDSIHIAVQDYGKGFEAISPLGGPSRSFGLVSVRVRMESLQGRLDIRSAPGAGTCATLIFPYRPLPSPVRSA